MPGTNNEKSIEARAKVARDTIFSQIAELKQIYDDAKQSHDYDAALTRLKQWSKITAKLILQHVSAEASQDFESESKTLPERFESIGQLEQAVGQLRHFLAVLLDNLERHPDVLLSPSRHANPAEQDEIVGQIDQLIDGATVRLGAAGHMPGLFAAWKGQVEDFLDTLPDQYLKYAEEFNRRVNANTAHDISEGMRILRELRRSIQSDTAPSDKASTPIQVTQNTPARMVFIIHGHDDLNLRRLKDLLREHYHLDPVVLGDKPGKGRTLIEKFEEEAQEAIFAFALLTPDDIVVNKKEDYTQPRPNVIFELGWFCGKLGRNRVCIIRKEGTKIHTDLEGINDIRFQESVEEKVLEVERELRAAGLLR